MKNIINPEKKNYHEKTYIINNHYLIGAGSYATNIVIKNTDVQISVGTLNVSIEQCSNGIYDLLILELLEPYQKISPRGKTLEQKAMLLKMRELFLAISQNVSL